MRILVCCTDLGVRVPGSKGASLHLGAIARAFAAVGHEVLVVGVAGHGAPPSGPAYRLLPHPGRRDGLPRELTKLRFTATFVDRVAPEVAAFAPEMVYERLSLFGTAGAELARRHAVPHVVEVNALVAAEEGAWRGLTLAHTARTREHRVLAEADLCVAVSAEVADQIRASVGDVPVRVVPNGVDAALFARPRSRVEARRTLGLARTGRLLGFVGSLRPWHGLETAIDALTRLPEDVGLLVAGDGPVRGTLQTIARERGVEGRITWLGQVPHGAVPDVLAAVDVAVAPYPALDDFAFSPLKLLDYMAGGAPIVASDIGQIRTLLADGALGRLVRPGDAAALAAACRATFTDPAAAHRAARARAVALAEHGWERRAHDIATAVAGLGRRHALAG